MAPDSQSGPPTPPTADDILRWVAAAAPRLWFPARHAEVHRVPRDQLDDPLWQLRQAELVQVGDWVPQLGQGFKLTPAGEAMVGRPLPPPPPEPLPEPPAAPDPALGETARRSILDPAPALITPLLLMAHVVWFVYGGVEAVRTRGASDYLKGSTDPIVNPILNRVGAVSGPALLNGEWWRLLTCQFVHVGLPHLLGNMIILGLLGTAAEGVWGRWRFTLLYLLCGVAGAVTAMAVNPQTVEHGAATDMAVGGASGGLFGVTAGMAVWVLRNLKHLPPSAYTDWARKLTVVLIMNVVVSFAPGVSVEAQLGGGLAGPVIALCLARIRGADAKTTAAVGGLVVLAAGFVTLLSVSMTRTDEWRQVRERHDRRAERIRQPADPPAKDDPARRD
jgi:membrane associated rhomboid family serine protease